MTAAAAPGQRILIADAIAAAGVALLRDTPGLEVRVLEGPEDAAQLATLLPEFDALIVRSATRVTAALLAHPGRLRVVGRAGSGVDTIDVEAATRAGVVVLNTPGGNSIAAAEHTMSLLLALARNIPQAHAALQAGRWERGRWMGVEVAGKTLGVVGLGRVGLEVARRAQALRMRVVGHDPYVPERLAEEAGIAVLPFERLLEEADFVTLHVPLLEATRGLIGATALARLRPGARLINCARGELIDDEALLAALESGRLAGAALDVFAVEPPVDRRLVEHPAVIATPHLGASTVEAQERVGVEVAGKIREFLLSGTILDAVNFPSLTREEYAALRPVLELAEALGKFVGQIAEGGASALEVAAFGDFAGRPLRPIVMAAVKGLLSPVLAEGVSWVNALTRARERGLTVDERRSHEPTPYAGLLRLRLTTDMGAVIVAGTLFTVEHPRLVEVDGVELESSLSGHMLFFRNRDVPGVVGRVGTLLAESGVNIAAIQLGRAGTDGRAVSIVSVDSPVPPAALAALRALPEILTARTLSV